MQHPSSLAYTARLSALITKWPSESTLYRTRLINSLADVILQCEPRAYADVAILTLHTVAHFLSRDAALDAPSPNWSAHPRYTESLLHAMLNLLLVCLTPHTHLPPPATTALPAALLHINRKPPATIERRSPHIPHLRVLRTALERAAPRPHHFSIAFLLSQLSALASAEPAIPLREAALRVLHALLQVLDPPLLAAFVPGVASSVTQIIANPTRLHSRVAVPAIAVFNTLVERTFPHGRPPLGGGSGDASSSHAISTMAQALNHLSLDHTEKRAPPHTTSPDHAPASARDTTPPTPPLPPPAERPLRIAIDDKWLRASAKQLSLRLSIIVRATCGPRLHNRQVVRLLFVRFSSRRLRSSRALLDLAARRLLTYALVEACANPFAAVAVEARRTLVRCGPRQLEIVLRACLAYAGFLDTPVPAADTGKSASLLRDELDAIKALEEAADEHLAHTLCAGILAVLVPHQLPVIDANDPHVTNASESGNGNANGDVHGDVHGDVVDDPDGDRIAAAVDDINFGEYVEDDSSEDEDGSHGDANTSDFHAIPLDRLPAFVNRVGVVPFANMLVALHESHWKPARVARHAVADAMCNRVLVAARQMGVMELLPCVYDSLLSIARGGEDDLGVPFLSEGSRPTPRPGEGPPRDVVSFKVRAHAVMVAHAVVRGAMLATDPGDADDDARTAHVFVCARELVEVISGLFVPDVETASDEEVRAIDDTVLSLKLGLLRAVASIVSELVEFQRRAGQRPIGSEIVLVCIMDLLRDATHGEVTVRPAAEEALESVAKATRCDSIRQLLMRHLNYVLGRVIRNLHEVWAGDVLRYVIGKEADEVSREATVLLLRTMKGLSDGLAGASDGRAMQTLASMRSVLKTAVSQCELADIGAGVEDAAGAPRMEREVGIEIAIVQRAMMTYCTEKVDSGDMPSEVEDEGPGNDMFDGFGDEDEEAQKNPFNEIAESVLDGARDLLVGRDWAIRAAALECAVLAIRLLKGRKKLLLPHVAKLLPLLPEQFACMDEELNAGGRMLRAMRERKVVRGRVSEEAEEVVRMVNGKGAELPVVRHACMVVSTLAECAGSFVQERFVRLVYPRMRPLLRLCEWFPTLVSGSGVESGGLLPSYGAMAACDACLEAVAAMAVRVPIAVAPFAGMVTGYVAVFFDDMWKPGSRRGGRAARGNASTVRFEMERWERRLQLAERIVAAVGRIRGDEVFLALLCRDREAPTVLRNGNDDRLQDIVVR